MMMALSLLGCAKNETSTADSTEKTTSADATKIALILPYIGDQSYFDTASKGLDLVKTTYGDKVDTNLIEMGVDAAGWETAYRQVAADGYDIIISGNFQYESAMLKVAKDYPDVHFLNFDYGDAKANELPNVYGLSYAANEAGFLAGVVAALKSESGVIGCVGGMDIDGIKQFLAGYIQGALEVNPNIKVLTGFIGNFQDTATAKEVASNMIDQGADVLYHAAGGAGNGVFEAASEKGVFAIGVDTDQRASLSDKPKLADAILTSSTKNCDQGIVLAIGQMLDGTAPYGKQKVMSFKDGAVGLAENDYYKANMTKEQLDVVESFKQKLTNGEIEVIDQLKDNTAFDTMSKKASK